MDFDIVDSHRLKISELRIGAARDSKKGRYKTKRPSSSVSGPARHSQLLGL